MTEFQQLVDGLAMRLKRAVAIDDREVRLVAYSSHEGVAVDPLRQYSILNRRVPLEVVQYVHKHALNSSAPVHSHPRQRRSRTWMDDRGERPSNLRYLRRC
jgi:hypothetical protein